MDSKVIKSILEIGETIAVEFKLYSGKNPEFIEGDIFRIIVPLKEEQEEITTQSTQSATHLNGMDPVQEIMKLIGQEPFLSQKQMAENFI